MLDASNRRCGVYLQYIDNLSDAHVPHEISCPLNDSSVYTDRPSSVLILPNLCKIVIQYSEEISTVAAVLQEAA